MSEVIKQFVGRAVCIRDDKILLVNKIGEPHWFLPGGRLEEGESLKDCVKREIKEELNLDSTVGNFLGCIEHAFSSSTKNTYEVGFFFLVEIQNLPESDEIKSNEKELRFQWLTLDEFKEFDIRPPPVFELLKNVSGIKDTFWSSTLKN